MSVEQDLHKGIQEAYSGVGLVTRWVLTVEVVEPDNVTLRYSAGGGDEGEDMPSLWDVYGMLGAHTLHVKDLLDMTRTDSGDDDA